MEKVNLDIKTGRIGRHSLDAYCKLGYVPIFICRFMNPLVKCYEGSDIHLPEAAPSSSLLFRSKRGEIDWETYRIEYVKELNDRKFSIFNFLGKIYNIVNLSNAKGAILLCYCLDNNKCHRSILANIINESELLTDKVIELYV